MGRPSCVVEISPGVFDFVTNYHPYSRRTYFFRARAVIIASGRDTNVCEDCGKHTNQTHIHHEDQDITNTRSTNLRVVCIPCHKKRHPERLQFHYDDIYSVTEQVI